MAVAMLFTGSAYAQLPGVSKITKVLPKVDLGVKLGANFQQLSGDAKELQKAYKGGVVGGLFVGVFKGKMGVQAEGLLKTVKYDFKTQVSTTPVSYSVNALYFDVPLLFEYKLAPRIWAQIGPQYSIMLSAKNSVNSNDVKSSFNSADISGVLGIEATLPFHLTAGARYILGFSDVNNNSVSGYSGSLRNRSIQAYVGFRFL